MSRKRPAGAASIWQMWNVVSVVLAVAAGLLFAAGYTIPGAIASCYAPAAMPPSAVPRENEIGYRSHE